MTTRAATHRSTAAPPRIHGRPRACRGCAADVAASPRACHRCLDTLQRIALTSEIPEEAAAAAAAYAQLTAPGGGDRAGAARTLGDALSADSPQTAMALSALAEVEGDEWAAEVVAEDAMGPPPTGNALEGIRDFVVPLVSRLAHAPRACIHVCTLMCMARAWHARRCRSSASRPR